MSKLPDPDHHHFLAAEGWLELGNIQECYNELEEISPMYKTHRDALELRVKMYAKAEKWDHVEPIAETLARLIPDAAFGVYMWCHSLRMRKRYKEALVQLTLARGKFLNDWRFSYDMACCLAIMGHKEEACLKLGEAFDLSTDRDIRLTALDEPDLEPIWVDISDM